MSSFQGDDSGPDSYLKTLVAPARLADAQTTLTTAINALNFDANEFNRNVPAALRDASANLFQYKDVGGAIIYMITSTGSTGSDQVLEADLSQKLVANNIKLIAAETGNNGELALNRFSILSQGSYYPGIEWGTTAFFTPINTEIVALASNIFKLDRRTVRNSLSCI